MTERERKALRLKIDKVVRDRVDKVDRRRFCFECGEPIQGCICRHLVDDLMQSLKGGQ